VNIIQTTITYPPSLGGLDRYVKETTEGLIKRGHDVSVVTTDLEQPFSRNRLTIPSGYTDVGKVHRLPTFRIPRLGLPIPWKAGSIIRQHHPDIIHAHCAFHSVAPIAWRVARQVQVPFILNTVFSPRPGAFWKLYLRMARRMIGQAACVIAISDFERELLIREGISGDRVTVLFPGVDLTIFKTPRASIYPRYRLERNRVIVSLGRLAFGKRVDRLIQAMPGLVRNNPDLRLLVIGPDYGDESRLRRIVSDLALDTFVIFTGPLEEEDVAAALQWSSAFVMTSDFELFGITLIEAMAAGTAVVAPNVASVPNVVRHGETGLLYRHDSIDDLTTTVVHVLADERLRRSLTEAAKNDVRTRFDFERNLDRLQEIYVAAIRANVSRRNA